MVYPPMVYHGFGPTTVWAAKGPSLMERVARERTLAQTPPPPPSPRGEKPRGPPLGTGPLWGLGGV
jgi:hypothetical protein